MVLLIWGKDHDQNPKPLQQAPQSPSPLSLSQVNQKKLTYVTQGTTEVVDARAAEGVLQIIALRSVHTRIGIAFIHICSKKSSHTGNLIAAHNNEIARLVHCRTKDTVFFANLFSLFLLFLLGLSCRNCNRILLPEMEKDTLRACPCQQQDFLQNPLFSDTCFTVCPRETRFTGADVATDSLFAANTSIFTRIWLAFVDVCVSKTNIYKHARESILQIPLFLVSEEI